jgi:hypothetical protein
MKKSVIYIVVGLTALTSTLSSLFLGDRTGIVGAISPFLTAVGVISGLVALYKVWIWRWPICFGWLSEIPDLRGTWKIRFDYGGKDVETNERFSGTKEGYARIEQRASEFKLRVFTDETNSESIAYVFRRELDHVRLCVVYQNSANPADQDKEWAIHRGTAIYVTYGSRPSRFGGEYFTQKSSRGKVTLSDRRKDAISDFADGQTLYSKPPKTWWESIAAWWKSIRGR